MRLVCVACVLCVLHVLQVLHVLHVCHTCHLQFGGCCSMLQPRASCLPPPSPPPPPTPHSDSYWPKLLLPLLVLVAAIKFTHAYPPYKRKSMLAAQLQSAV